MLYGIVATHDLQISVCAQFTWALKNVSLLDKLGVKIICYYKHPQRSVIHY